MDPLSIVAFAATILDMGLRVSSQMNSIITTWRTANPAIIALANEVSVLNLILDRMSHACEAIRDAEKRRANRDDDCDQLVLFDVFNSCLRQAEGLLDQLEDILLGLKDIGNIKRKYKWLKKTVVAAGLQERLRDVRQRITELLITYNVTSVSRIELQIAAIQDALHQRPPSGAVQRGIGSSKSVTEMLELFLLYQQTERKKVADEDRVLEHSPASGITSPIDSVCPLTPSAATPLQALSRPGGSICPSICQCRCHCGSKWSFQFSSRYLGKVFVGYNGIIGNSASCSESSCRARQAVCIELSYVFPSWLLLRSINTFLIHTYTAGGPSAGLFLARRILGLPGTLPFIAYQLQGDVATLEKMVADNPYSVNDAMQDGRTAIHCAFLRRNFDVVRFLLQRGADADICGDDGCSTRMLALRAYLGPEDNKSRWNRTAIASLVPIAVLIQEVPLLVKAIVGLAYLDVTRMLTEINSASAREMVNTPDGSGYFPLMWAVIYRDLPVVRAILQAGADPNIGTVTGGTCPLAAARVLGGRRDCDSLVNGMEALDDVEMAIFDELVNFGADINLVDQYGVTVLQRACEHGDLPLVKRLVRNGADPNRFTTGSNLGTRPSGGCHSAALHNHHKVLRFLDQAGANLEAQDGYGNTPLTNAVSYNSYECIQFLIQQGVNHLATNSRQRNILHLAAITGDANTIRILAQEGGNGRLLGLEPDKAYPADQTPQELFQARQFKSAEVQLAWNDLLEALGAANSGVVPIGGVPLRDFEGYAWEENCSDDEFYDAVEEDSEEWSGLSTSGDVYLDHADRTSSH